MNTVEKPVSSITYAMSTSLYYILLESHTLISKTNRQSALLHFHFLDIPFTQDFNVPNRLADMVHVTCLFTILTGVVLLGFDDPAPTEAADPQL
ncbi:hypothetical protein M501DRAFT_997891 [Patellaria atrata CBS 101060]|uniref:Uncharacterized protein n=1 Tax=Patellaria atrata CBS 101060 TaxID=1346257 RepID=A0A9P4VLN0_9PEZI|nr:hypothetical protein M501DRAFT_997891 [Patellaria atrata CBS 101060]